MIQKFLLSFRENIFIIEKLADAVVLKSPFINLTLKQLAPGLLDAFKILAADGATEEQLSDLVLQTDGAAALPKFYYYLQKFIDLHLICHTLVADDLPLATIVPISRYYQSSNKTIDPDKKYILSRFAYCRRNKDQMVLESPLSHARIILCDRRSTALITELIFPHTYSELATKFSDLSLDTVKLFLNLLLSADFLSEVEENGTIQEEENLTLAQWNFHDLLFHSRSRLGRHLNFYADTNRFTEEIKQIPVVKPKMSDEIIDLHKPDIEKLKKTDSPFTLVLEQRKSIRSHAEKVITDKQLGEFLYRSARFKNIVETDSGEISSRPYPTAGADYELELYIVINKCENIPAGLYHYCPKEHQLSKISDKNNYVETMLQGAGEAVRQPPESLQILIIIAARFLRRVWAYSAIAYALTLKHAGILSQTMYLVATAMNLAPCAVGFGDSDLFAAAVGTDYYAETSVGEFILGCKETE